MGLLIANISFPGHLSINQDNVVNGRAHDANALIGGATASGSPEKPLRPAGVEPTTFGSGGQHYTRENNLRCRFVATFGAPRINLICTLPALCYSKSRPEDVDTTVEDRDSSRRRFEHKRKSQTAPNARLSAPALLLPIWRVTRRVESPAKGTRGPSFPCPPLLSAVCH